MPHAPYRPIAVDLFAGAGGMSLGFEQAGFDVLAAVDIDPIHCATHQFNFPHTAVLCRSVVDLTAAEIRNRSSIGDRQIDVVFGGSPCQGFSLMGKRALDDPRNLLVFHFQRLVLALKPKFFVLENVRGLTIGKHRQVLTSLIAEFKAAGYQVKEDYQVLNAAWYGVPQSRARLFLIGCRVNCQLPKYPVPITSIASPERERERGSEGVRASRGSRGAGEAFSTQHLTLNTQHFLQHSTLHTPHFIQHSRIQVGPNVWDAIGDLPEVEDYPELFQQDWIECTYGKPSEYALKLRGLCAVADDYSYVRVASPQENRQFDSRLLSSSWRTKHTALSIARFQATPQGEREPISRFYKLHPQGVCNTLRAGTDQQRGAFTSPRPIHPFTPRCITVREAARLHSYPDWFRFHVTKWHGFRQVGNSVPPLLAKAIATEIIRASNVQPEKPAIVQPLGDESWLHLKMSQAVRLYAIEIS
jgi:DNA (cytosine-5)-methyltransferase 1